MNSRLVAAAALLLAASGCIGAEPSPSTPPPTEPTAEPAACEAKSFRAANLTVSIATSKGAIEATLFGAAAPISVCNFLRYAEENFYDGTIWHRACTHVIQAGGYDPYTNTQKATHDPIVNEANSSQHRNYKGTLGMARSSDPDSATSHFYINRKDNTYLDWDGQYAPGYAVFGNVTKGMEVVEAIATAPTVPDPPSAPPVSSGGCNGRPVPGTATTITDVKVLA